MSHRHGDHSDALLHELLERGEMPSHPAIGAPGAESWVVRQFIVADHFARATREQWQPAAELRCDYQGCRERRAVLFETPCPHGPLFYGKLPVAASRAAIAAARANEGGARVDPYYEVVADLLGDFWPRSNRWWLPLVVGCPGAPVHPVVTVDRARLLRWFSEQRYKRLPSISISAVAQR